jgi:hypothetical protein
MTTCKQQVYVCPVDQTDMKDCGEPVLVNGVCYDHSYLRPVCHEEPTFPHDEPCEKCKECSSCRGTGYVGGTRCQCSD